MKTTGTETDRPSHRGFAALAGRMSGYTSRVLLSAVVVVAGVGFGRQVLRWWRDDAAAGAPPPAAAVPGLGDPWAAHEVIVGDRPWSIARQTFEGDAAAAVAALLAACQAEAGETDVLLLPQPGSEERELLARLAGGEPDGRAPGGVSLYALRDGFPMVVGTRTGKPGAGASAQDTEPSVAVWGIAVPAAPTRWSLYTFRPRRLQDDASTGRPRRERAGEPTAKPPTPPLPPGCRQLLAVQAAGGDRSIVFVGPGSPDEWKAFYDGWAEEAGLQRQGRWQPSVGAWYATYRSAAPDRTTTVDFHLDRGRGLILITP